MNWLISENASIYNHASSFEHNRFIDWRQGNTNFDFDDIVYVYCTKPLQTIRYKCKIQRIGIEFKDIQNDKSYWLDSKEYDLSKNSIFMRLLLVEQIDNSDLNLNYLLQNGLKAAPQGPKKINGELLEYIEKNFNENHLSDIYPEMINENEEIYEGIKKQILVNKYERSSMARRKCIEFNGISCSICGFNFEEQYGEIGKDFIHIHHIVPLNEIGKEYKVDYKNDLVPVCPNCHAMLHRKLEGKEINLEKFREILMSKK